MIFSLSPHMVTVTMASDSRDGQIVTKTLERIGVITVDGPKGPYHKVKQSILAIAQRTWSTITLIRGCIDKSAVFKRNPYSC